MWKSKMHQKGHSNTARCSLEPELENIDQNRICGPARNSGLLNSIYSYGFWFGHLLVVDLLSQSFH